METPEQASAELARGTLEKTKEVMEWLSSML